MKSAKLFCLAALAASLLAGCGSASKGGGSTPPPPPPPPTPTVKIAVTRPAVLGENGVKVNYAYNFTVTNSAGSDTASSCASSSANLLVVNDATGCVFTPTSAPATGDATVTVTAHADSTVTATFTVHVGSWALVESQSYGMQLVNVVPKTAPVTIMANNQHCGYATFSSDYQKIICVDIMSPGPSVFNVFQTDGTAAGTVQVGASIDMSGIGSPGRVTVYCPRFSPDGKQILFTAAVNANVERGIWIANADGSKPVELYNDSADYNGNLFVERVRFTPDGKQILFRKLSTGTLWIMNADGTNPHELVAAQAEWGMYSPDMSMSKLYYTHATGTQWNFNILDVATGITKMVQGYDIMDVSPDGNSLLLTDATNMYTADADGNNITLLATGVWGSGY